MWEAISSATMKLLVCFSGETQTQLAADGSASQWRRPRDLDQVYSWMCICIGICLLIAQLFLL